MAGKKSKSVKKAVEEIEKVVQSVQQQQNPTPSVVEEKPKKTPKVLSAKQLAYKEYVAKSWASYKPLGKTYKEMLSDPKFKEGWASQK